MSGLIKMIHNFVNGNIEKYDIASTKNIDLERVYKKLLYMIGLIVGSITWFENKYNINVTAFKPKNFKKYDLTDKESILYFKMMFITEADSLTAYYFKEHKLQIKNFKRL